MVSPTVKKLAQRLLVLEGARAPASESGTGVAVRVVEQFRVRLNKLAGVDGFRSLLSRALTLARMDVPSLKSASVSLDGRLVGLEEGDQEGCDLVAHLLDLLINFIGESLTLQLVSDVWPEASTDEPSSDATSAENGLGHEATL